MAASSDRNGGGDPVYSVTEVTRAIKRMLEGGFSSVWIEGEVSNHRCPSSGHHYFTLKDAGAQLPCVLFRGQAQQNRVELADGLQIQVSGDISVYEARGQYQLIAQWVQPKGLGALQAKFEALKAKLQAEHLFDSGTKISIPRFPKTIAVVTSPTGAAIQDILNVIKRRAPWVEVLVMPVAVQGRGAEREIESAIRWLSTRPESLPRIDTLIVARGGGSLEDLWSFNNEGVARALYECPIPVISGVGHEIDFTIADFVADRREPTPSAAAEFAVPDGQALRGALDVVYEQLENRLEDTLWQQEQRLDMLSQTFENLDVSGVVESLESQATHLVSRLDSVATESLYSFRERLNESAAGIEMLNPEKELGFFEKDLERLARELGDNMTAGFERKEEQLRNYHTRLESVSPVSVLKRGFSMTLDESGEPVMDSDAISDGETIRTVVAHGELKSVVKK